MGLTISWDWQAPDGGKEAESIIAQMHKRAMDLPFESVGEIVHFKGEDARFERGRPDDEFRWFKLQAQRSHWNREAKFEWDCPAMEIVGFDINVAPGSEWMSVFLATYPKTILAADQESGRPKRIRTGLHGWSGKGFSKTQYASDPRCGGVANFLRAHLSICRMLDHARELGLEVHVADDAKFFECQDIPALIQTLGEWNQQIAAFVGAFTDMVGKDVHAPIRGFPNFEHLEAKGQNQIDVFLKMLKDDGTEHPSP
jgi:hypothetical protein